MEITFLTGRKKKFSQMCGFFFIKKNGIEYNLNILKKYSNLIKHRGPDDDRIYNDKFVYSRFFRLSILDTSSKASQPMFDVSKRYMLLFNGEIYNFKDLKKKLKFKNLRSNSDSEVLLYCLIEKGISIFNDIEGMFSFIFYDFKENKILFARDRLGIKPLYFTQLKRSFIFSSEIKPLLPFQNIQINNSSFCNFFLKGSMDHNNETFFKNIVSVENGQFGEIKNNKIFLKKYWELSKTKKNEKSKSKKIELKNLLDDTLNKHLISDRKIGLFLSGGTDSNALLNLILDKKKTKDFPTFTYGFKDSEIYSELPRVKSLLFKKNTSNFNYLLKPNEIIKNFDNITEILETPLTSIRIFAMKKLYNLAKKRNCKVIIEGDGGDEIFAGYDYNLFSYLKDKYKNNGIKILDDLKRFITKSKKKKSHLINLLLTNSYQFSSTSDGTIFVNSNFFNSEFLNQNIDELFYKYQKNKNFNNLQNAQLKDLFCIKLPRTLSYKDRLSMSEGIEARVPLLDHRLVEFGFHLSNELKFDDLRSRYIFKNIFKKNIKKNKFEYSKRTIADPQKIWLKNQLKEYFLDNVNSIDFKKLDYFNQNAIKAEFLEFCKNDNYPSTFAFIQILSFFRFQKTFKKLFN